MDKAWPADQQCVIQVEEDNRDGQGAGHRRPSTSSLSRFRSCPELSAAGISQDSPASDMAPMTDQEGTLIHTVPMIRNSLCVDLPSIEICRSAAATPSPPSSPESQRKDNMSTSFHSYLSTARKLDGQGHALFTGHPLKEENLRRLEELRICGQHRSRPSEDVAESDRQWTDLADDECSMCTNSRHHTVALTEQESVEKCTLWLQNNQLNSTDKIKSRSQIQLTPI